MVKPQEFIETSDYATPKNDDNDPISIVVPASMAIASNGVWESRQTITLGTSASSMRAQGNSSRAIDDWIAANQINYPRTGTVSGSPSSYTLAAVLTRTSPTTVELYVGIYNPYGSTLTTQSGSETITFSVYTLLSPFS